MGSQEVLKMGGDGNLKCKVHCHLDTQQEAICVLTKQVPTNKSGSQKSIKILFVAINVEKKLFPFVSFVSQRI